MMADTMLDRLQTVLAGDFKTFGGALDLDGLRKAPPAPALFVIPMGERGGANETAIGETTQRVVQTYGVISALTVRNDQSGGAAEQALDLLRNKIKAALIGWQPTSGHVPVTFLRGRLLAIEGGRAWWEDVFETAIWERG